MSSPLSVTFTAELFLAGKTATAMVLPDEVVEALGRGKRPPVVVRLPGHSYRSTVSVMGGRFMLPVAAEHREAAGLSAGDRVEVTLTLDEAPRTVDVPIDLAEALAAAGLTEAFEAMSYSHRKEHVRAVEDAKKPETRARRVAKAVDMIAAGAR